ncbi:ras guanine nucleotide exchange factor domain-containing protein [Elsinoe ampelina]|uniref:Ras guanine nucleotide exchange factor domain-containing protein n=1 Tax=Elsinoe ampelina TaxID=302913 RepID=A0A6A6G638_9PEZI|nr:ras guanine nucleotide exchange factor domain-containing protein [Elsinoe ampelina]
MPSQVRESRRSSNVGISSRSDRRGSLKSKQNSEERRGSIKSQDALASRTTTRTISELNLTSLQREELREGRDEVQHDLYDRPLRSPRRRSSRNSRSNLISYGSHGLRALDSEVTYDVNVVVLGNESVGKTTFIHRTLDLDAKDVIDPPCRILTIAGNLCMVRMFEMNISDCYQGENDALSWPDRLKHTTIHGVMTLYDVGNKSSFKLVPEVLNCVNMMGMTSILAACKCDIRDSARQLEPRTIEQRATSAFDRITTLQTSEAYNEPFRRAISAVLKHVVNQSQDNLDGAGPRRRTLPQLPGPVNNRRPPPPGHSRSTSEIPGYRRNEYSSPHAELSRNGSSSASKSTSVSSRREDLSSSFLMDESHTEDSASHTSVSAHETDASEAEIDQSIGTPQTPQEEMGWTFDSLVNRLLAVPTSKADSKFAAVFLALYRKFSPPGQLLEGIVVRFESIEHTEPVLLTRTVAQLRYLTVIEQWIHRYPGDFAHPKTLRRIKTFIAKLQRNRIFAAAAQEMNNHLEFVAEDDDTEWACCDKERTALEVAKPSVEYSYRGSLLIDDPQFEFPDDMGSLSLHSSGGQRKASNAPSDSGSVSSSGRRVNLCFEDVAQREASKLVPNPKTPLTKQLWRHLMAIPHESIAKEMTRMDWIMFSSIRPRDLVRHVSLSQAQKARCKSLANVSRMIDHFNYVRDWVINFVLYRDKPKHRALMLEKFMQVARKLRELNNYNSLGAVLAGIKSTPVYRLVQTKDMVSPEVMKDWMKLEILMSQSRSFSSYRLAWENSNGERIPYLPLPIRDLVGAETGNKTFMGDDSHGRINWNKFEVMGDVLVSLQRAQGLPYRSALLGPKNDEVQRMVLQTKIIRDDDALYDRSVHLEASASSGNDRRGFKDFFKR